MGEGLVKGRWNEGKEEGRRAVEWLVMHTCQVMEERRGGEDRVCVSTHSVFPSIGRDGRDLPVDRTGR